MGEILVQKYGGTSVATPERIRKVADRIAVEYRKGKKLVIVVSAMGKTTDALISLAHEVSSEPPHREMDMLLSVGERISMALLSMALERLKIPAISLTGSQSGIITSESHRRARIETIRGDRVKENLDLNRVVIVAGFQGMSVKKEITTLGRGGSDTTAVALAAALKAERCEIYTDVDGVFSADPRVVSDAKQFKSIPSSLMVELAHLGAGVLHPRCVELAKKFDVPLAVLNSLKEESKGTVIVNQTEKLSQMERFEVVGITADEDRFLLTITLARPSVVSALFDQISKKGLSVVSPIFDQGIVKLYAEKEFEGEWKKILSDLVRDEFVSSFDFRTDLIPLSVVGECVSSSSTVLCELIDVLSKNHISVFQGIAGNLSLTFAIPATHQSEAVQAIHDHYFKEKTG